MDLVTKFENVKVKQSSLLPPEDIEFCKNEQQRLDETLVQLRSWLNYFTEQSELDTNPVFSIEKYYSWDHTNDTLSVKRRDSDNDYDDFKFTPKYPMVHIQTLRKKAKTHFIKTIMDHFKVKYHIPLETISCNNEEDLDKYIKYDAIIDHIRGVLGHLDFKMIALDNAIAKLHKQVTYRPPELKGRTVTFPDCIYYGYYSEPAFNENVFERWMHINNALAIFETDNLHDTNWSLGSAVRGKDIDFTYEYPLINSTRAVSVRFYKNRKVIIKFIDAQAARDFMNRFQFQITETK